MKVSKVSRLINSILLYAKKNDKVTCYAYNDELHPVLAKQLESIIKQAKKIGDS